jgi:hypothetical protein
MSVVLRILEWRKAEIVRGLLLRLSRTNVVDTPKARLFDFSTREVGRVVCPSPPVTRRVQVYRKIESKWAREVERV